MSVPSLASRAAFAVSLALAVAVYVVALGKANPDFTSDFDQVWAGARALWEGKDPYAVVGPGREFGWNWPLYYPLPALVALATASFGSDSAVADDPPRPAPGGCTTE